MYGRGSWALRDGSGDRGAARSERAVRSVRSVRSGRSVRGSAAGCALALAGVLLGGCSSDSGTGDDGAGGGGVAQRPESVTPYWVDPEGNAARQAERYAQDGKKKQAALMRKIARQPVAEWIRPDDPEAQTRKVTTAASKAGRDALLVLYNLPHRDCGQYSKGGAPDAAAYRKWLAGVLKGIGKRPATVIVEPDAVPHLLMKGCTPAQYTDERYELLNEAVGRLQGLPDVRVYLDAGNPDWVRDPGALVEPMKRAGVETADGFSLNVSNYQTTASNTAYGKKFSPMVGNKPFVIDTSRNGNGPVRGAGADEEAWCNPKGRALGEAPTTKTGDQIVDGYLWIKRPGESDGECKGGPKAGQWWPEYALDLAGG
ncbi:endoglucanase [Streptomyces nanshensis]|uniref:Glucanase n=1 Tax=Streptomyces nanshensis TaxID=518642 RepID=A0A1E7L228_9ACTN|nr:glycoside hydrolase family 6 protein [Streptomyces nanshensis]OEV10240.1 endoglucanase [Streptomyces nanshensis]